MFTRRWLVDWTNQLKRDLSAVSLYFMASFFISTTRKWKAYNNNTTQHIDNISKPPVCLYIRPQITEQTQSPKSLNKPKKKKKKDFPFFLSLSRVIWPAARIFNYSNNIVWTPPFYIRRLQLSEINPSSTQGRKDEKEKQSCKGGTTTAIKSRRSKWNDDNNNKKNTESLFSYLAVCVLCGQLKRGEPELYLTHDDALHLSQTPCVCIRTYKGTLISADVCTQHTHTSLHSFCVLHT